MSQKNVEVVKEVLAAFSRYDFDGALEYMHRDVVLEMADEDPLYGKYVGREQVKTFWMSLFRFWDGWKVETERLEDAGDTVVVVYRVLLRGRESGIPLEQRLAQLAKFRDGKVARTQLYRDVGKALEAVGLGE
ncbi:MAG: nuclear transport factor 2 family protein [Thermoleophilaceae bacterium]|nr:nuclear transport factor 2 family protein [Thermoleophilaceae bacterium]